MISFEEFKKIELKIAKIIEADRIDGSNKLLKLKVDLGEEKRIIVAGIQKYYKTADLIGKEILIVTNLEPRKLAGIDSQGMLLAANDNEEPVILIPAREVPPGTEVT